jgi:signal transduction histidine kinase
MSSVPPSGRPGNFLVALLRRGAPVIADMPTDLPEQVVDPNPQPGWRRITAMAGSTDPGVTDSLLVRACRYVVLVPLAYRIFVVPVTFLAFAAGTPQSALGSVAGLAALLVALNILAVVWVLRVPGFRYSVARTLLCVDAVVAVAANLVVPLLAPPGHYTTASAVSWTYLIGSVALWTLVWGVPSGVLLTLFSAPLQVAMLAVGGATAQRGSVFLGALDKTIMLVAALVTAMVGLTMVGLGTRLALGVGIRRGREWENARNRRALHDTVLQTLEAMALPLPSSGPDAETAEALAAQLAELRGIARAQAMELRRGLDQPVDTAESGAGLGEDLAGLAAEMAREGLRARLVFSDVDGAELSDVRRLAVRDAVREALRNTMKHAGTDEVVLRVEQRDGGIAVIARDHGEGFDEAERPPGFGISNSISARLAEVGGSSIIESRPGNGTRVTLWVPL